MGLSASLWERLLDSGRAPIAGAWGSLVAEVSDPGNWGIFTR